MDINCLKIVYGDSEFFLIKREKKTASIIGPAEKNYIKKKITSSIIGPAMAGPTGPFATALQN